MGLGFLTLLSSLGANPQRGGWWVWHHPFASISALSASREGEGDIEGEASREKPQPKFQDPEALRQGLRLAAMAPISCPSGCVYTHMHTHTHTRPPYLAFPTR